MLKIIMHHRLLYLVIIAAIMLCSCSNSKKSLTDEELRQYAAQMLMVGFKGDSIDESSDAYRYLHDLKPGGIILFDVDLTGSATIGSRNITSKPQLIELTRRLNQWADYKLLIAVDQEGGRVVRLKPQYGFSPIASAEYLGTINNRDTTYHYASVIANEMAEAGLNVNLGPILDVNVNPECPVIGGLQRSFSADTAVVTSHARTFIDAHKADKVVCAVKHFPGHGSATDDSHYGLTDVTSTWNESELAPFDNLIKENKIDIIMTAHIFNRNIDPKYPATLSHKIITELLREKMGYKGVVLTDDMYMKGIIDNYDIEEAVILAINAGADMLIMGNNISTGFEPDRPYKIVDMIVRAVKNGKIDPQRLIDAHNRIESLKSKL